MTTEPMPRQGARPGTTNGSTPPAERRPFRAADVLTGSIDRRRAPVVAPTRTRKQISAQLEPNQVRLLGELHARLNATTTARIEKSDLVGLGIELLAAVLDTADGGFAPAPGRETHGAAGDDRDDAIVDLASLRAYVRTHVRAYEGDG